MKSVVAPVYVQEWYTPNGFYGYTLHAEYQQAVDYAESCVMVEVFPKGDVTVSAVTPQMRADVVKASKTGDECLCFAKRERVWEANV